MKKNKSFLNWSGGKDAAFALYRLSINPAFSVEKLLTTANKSNKRVNMHGVRMDLMQQQAKAVGIPLETIYFENQISLEEYNQEMNKRLLHLKSDGFTHSIFGDILLEDLKRHREQQLQKIELKGVFPLWKENTKPLIQDFIKAGFKAIVVSINAKYLDKSFCGRIIDEQFLNDLPQHVDWCGENGEFHTFVFDGPLFKNPVEFEVGKTVMRTYSPSKKEEEKDCFKTETESWDTQFWFTDLKPL